MLYSVIYNNDNFGNKCTFVCFSVLSSVILYIYIYAYSLFAFALKLCLFACISLLTNKPSLYWVILYLTGLNYYGLLKGF